MNWIPYTIAFGVFFLTHSLPVRPPLRPWLQARLGPRGFTAAYSVLSVAVLVWLILAAADAPHVPLWPRAVWQDHVALTLMLPVCLILALALGRPNPFSFGGARNARFDPARPGIIRLTRHPLLAALALWAAAHVLPNGDLAHLLLFGTFAVFALIGRPLVERRTRRELGPAWDRLHHEIMAAPLLPRRPAPGDLIRIALGLAAYVALIWLHPRVLGVGPLPF